MKISLAVGLIPRSLSTDRERSRTGSDLVVAAVVTSLALSRSKGCLTTVAAKKQRPRRGRRGSKLGRTGARATSPASGLLKYPGACSGDLYAPTLGELIADRVSGNRTISIGRGSAVNTTGLEPVETACQPVDQLRALRRTKRLESVDRARTSDLLLATTEVSSVKMKPDCVGARKR